MWNVLGAGWLAMALLGFGIVSYRVVTKVLPDRTASVRATATILGLTWLLLVSFFALSVFTMFRAIPALLLSIAGAAIVLRTADARREMLAAARADGAALRSFWVGLSWPARIALVVLGASMAVMILAPTLVSPARAWDDHVYHLFKAGTWVNNGGFTSEPAPNSWNYFDYYSASGEVIWSWFLLYGRDGAYLGFASGLVWTLIGFGSLTVARQLGAGKNQAVLAAAAVLTVPAVMIFVDTAMVDDIELAAFLLGFVMLLECRRQFTWAAAAFALVGLFFAAGAKQSGAPLVVGGVVWIAVFAWRATRRRDLGRALLRFAGIFLLASLVAAPWYARSWIDRGNPMYPLELNLPGLHLAGDPQLDNEIGQDQRKVEEDASQGAISKAISELWDAGQTLSKDRPLSFNFPPFPAAYVIMAGVAGVVALVRRRRLVAPLLFMGFVVALAVQVIVAKNTVALRTIWAPYLGRLLLPAFACVVLLAATLPWWKWLRPIWYVLPALQLRLSISFLQRAGTEAGAAAMTQWLLNGFAFVAVAGVAIAAVLLVKDPRLRWAGIVVAVLSLFAATGIPLLDARNDYRYDQYQQLASLQPGLFHQSPTKCLVDLWKASDMPEGAVIDLAAGTQIPTNMTTYRYGFLGSNLQNELVYVSSVTDGSIVNATTKITNEKKPDEAAWLRRIAERKVEYVVIPPGNPPEAKFIANHPERFEQVATSCNNGAMYKVVTPTP